MKNHGENLEIGGIYWKGQQNSKTFPLTVIMIGYEGEPITNETVVFKGRVFFPKDEWSHKIIAEKDDNCDTLVACILCDTVIVKGVASYKRRNTGGYKNTGDQIVIQCLPNTIVKVFGYDRRDYILYKVTEKGLVLLENKESFDINLYTERDMIYYNGRDE